MSAGAAPQHQPHRDVEGDNDRRADNPAIDDEPRRCATGLQTQCRHEACGGLIAEWDKLLRLLAPRAGVSRSSKINAFRRQSANSARYEGKGVSAALANRLG
jgi:hypothetical protein